MATEYLNSSGNAVLQEDSCPENEIDCMKPRVLSSHIKTKGRKEQTHEEYLSQKIQFEKQGPTINTENWLLDESALKSLDRNKKSDRIRVLHACEKAYYNRDYEKCIELIRLGENIFGINSDQQAQNQKEEFDMANKKIRKSAKVERHIVELLHIKERCLQKMRQEVE